MKRVVNTQERNAEDMKIIRDILDGNTRAFGKLRDRYYTLILIAVKKMIHNEEDAEDLVQETFIKVYHALDRFKEGYTFSSWIYRIASNTCIDFLRKKRFPMVSISNPYPTSDDDMYLDIEDKVPTADIQMLTDERRDALNNAIASLPEKYRYIISLRHENNMDYKDIADKLRMPLGTVKAQLFRARKLLFEELKQNPVFQSEAENML